MPKLKGVQFETAVIERYRRREISVEKALIRHIWREIYTAGRGYNGSVIDTKVSTGNDQRAEQESLLEC